MPIEEVTIEADKLSSREKFWYRELCSVYPYGLNDNVYKVGNISRLWGHGIIVYSLFNKHPRKFHVRSDKHYRRRIPFVDVQSKLESLLVDYRAISFNHRLRTFILSLPKKCLQVNKNL